MTRLHYSAAFHVLAKVDLMPPLEKCTLPFRSNAVECTTLTDWKSSPGGHSLSNPDCQTKLHCYGCHLSLGSTTPSCLPVALEVLCWNARSLCREDSRPQIQGGLLLSEYYSSRLASCTAHAIMWVACDNVLSVPLTPWFGSRCILGQPDHQRCWHGCLV